MTDPIKTILLIQPPIRDFYFTAKRTIPYGLLCMASRLKQAGFRVLLADGLATSKSKRLPLPEEMAYLAPFYGKEDLSPFNLFHHFRHYGYSFEHLARVARDSGAFLVGISSLFTAYSEEALETARMVRKFHPNCHLVLGGHHPTEMPEQVMAEPAVDYVLRGEGEESFLRLAEALSAGESPKAIPGLVFRKEDGSLHTSAPALVTDPERFAAPAMELVNHKFYGRKEGASTVVVASRGCPMKCSYCCVSAGNSRFRRRSVSSVFQEIETAVTKHGARFVDFEDENLTLGKRWFLELIERIRARFGHLNLELRAMNGLYAPSLTPEIIRAMRESGFSTLNLSLCTTSQTQLKRFRRPDVREAAEAAMACARELGMDCVSYIIAGAPGQTAEESLADLLYLARQHTVAGVSTFYPAPGSEDFKEAERLGLVPKSCSLMRSSAVPVSHTTSRLEAVTLQRLGRVINFMKRLKKEEGWLPAPQPLPPGPFKLSNRNQTGKMLLQAFLHDGILRGITREGEAYPHHVCGSLAQAFTDRFEPNRLRA